MNALQSICMCNTCMPHTCRGQKRWSDFPETGVKYNCEPPSRCWELNYVTLQK